MFPLRSIASLFILALYWSAFARPMFAAESEKTNAPQNAPGVPASIGTVDPKRVFASYYKTKDVEQRILDARTAAKKELNDRLVIYKQAADAITELNQAIQSPASNQEDKDAKTKQRDTRIAEIKKMEEDIREFQQSRQKQVDDQALRLRRIIVEDMSVAIEKATKSKPVNLVLDRTGPSLNGIPFILYAPEAADITASVTNLLPSRDGAPDSGARADPGRRVSLERLAIVDMKKVIEQFYKTKDAEQRIADARKAAKKELDDRIDACKNMAGDIKKLNDEIQNPTLSTADKNSKMKQRDGKGAEYNQATRDLQEFQQNRKRQLEEQTIRMRSGIVHEIEKVITDIAHETNPDLVLDVGALGFKGLPVVVYSKRLWNVTDELVARVNSALVPERRSFSPTPSVALADFNRIFNALPEVRGINEEESRILSKAGTDINARTAAQDSASQKKAPQVARLVEAIQALSADLGADLVLNIGEKSIDGLDFVLRRDGLPDLTNRVLGKLGLPSQ